MPPSTISLPSVLPAQVAPRDVDTTPEHLDSIKALSKVTTPDETKVFICAMDDCYRLFRSKEMVMAHRKRDHNNSQDERNIITWN
ncbi:hypothetical protein ONZ45_g14003 [Pleurotus djamor]|nr:hypothetical protein ONZ45_g14003 [Pleurotus djamor]